MDESVARSSRAVVLTAAVASAASITVTAASSYILDPASQEFGLDANQATLLKYIPSLAIILVVFVAGVLGDRLGARRAMTYGSIAYLIGAALCAIAPWAWLVVLGLSILGIGASVMVIVSMGLIGSAITEPTERAKAFGTLGLMGPVVYLFAPVLAGLFVTYLNWRLVVVVWFALGAVSFVLSRALLRARPGNPAAGEMTTPILAGVVLLLITQVIARVSDYGFDTLTVMVMVATVVAAGALWFVHSRMSAPTLSFAPLKSRSTILLLVVCMTTALAALWYTTYLAFEYLYGLTSLQIALLMLPAQFAGMAGAKLIPRYIINKGLRAGAFVALIALALSQASFLLIGSDTQWLMAALMCLYAMATAMATVALSNAVMDSLPGSLSGSVASYRAAASRIGGALATLVVGILVLGTYNSSLNAQAADAGIPTAEADQIATSLNDQAQAGTEEVPPPGSEDAEVSEFQKAAMVDAMHAKAIFGTGITLASGALVLIAIRRRPEEPAESSQEATSSEA